MLFQRIQEGIYDFPEEEWSKVSDGVKDLISHLLVRDPSNRYSAADVLKHPWVALESPMSQLATPKILQRYNSVTFVVVIQIVFFLIIITTIPQCYVKY